MAKKIKKKRKETLRSLKKKAWDAFSLWIRQRYANHAGNVVCVTCGAIGHWKTMHAGHFFPKSRGLVYLFEERNVHVQCAVCNLFKVEQAKIDYTIFMQEKFGERIIDELEALSHHPAKFYREDYLNMIHDYKDRVAKLNSKWTTEAFDQLDAGTK